MQGLLPQQPSPAERVCTRLQHLHARKLDVRQSLARWPAEWGLSAHQDTAFSPKVYLVIRSDTRGMSHSANIGRGHAFGADLSLSLNTPTVSRFPAAATPFVSLRWRSTFSNTTKRPIALTGQAQPRFTLAIRHVGIDDRELGALSDRIDADSSPRVGEPVPALSRRTAGPGRPAAFSSCGCES